MQFLGPPRSALSLLMGSNASRSWTEAFLSQIWTVYKASPLPLRCGPLIWTPESLAFDDEQLYFLGLLRSCY